MVVRRRNVLYLRRILGGKGRLVRVGAGEGAIIVVATGKRVKMKAKDEEAGGEKNRLRV